MRSQRTADVIALNTCDFAVLSRADYLEVVQAKAKANRDLKLRSVQTATVFRGLPSSVIDTIAECMRPQVCRRPRSAPPRVSAGLSALLGRAAAAAAAAAAFRHHHCLPRS